MSQGVNTVETAGLMLTLYYTCMMIGRLVGSAIMKWIKSQHLLVVLGLAGTALLLVSMFSHGLFAVWTLVLCGVTNSIMYPTIFALGVAELGPLTSKGSGVLTIGNVGGAVIPPLFGALADKIGIQFALVIPIVAYLYVAYYGLLGYKPERDDRLLKLFLPQSFQKALRHNGGPSAFLGSTAQDALQPASRTALE